MILKAGAAAFVGFLAVLIAVALLSMPPSAPSSAGSILADRAKCSRILEAQQAAGIIAAVHRKDGRTVVSVNELAWAGADSEVKVSTGLAAYCVNSDDRGRHHVEIVGQRDGRRKGSVTDGQWQW